MIGFTAGVFFGGFIFDPGPDWISGKHLIMALSTAALGGAIGFYWKEKTEENNQGSGYQTFVSFLGIILLLLWGFFILMRL